MPAKGFVSLVGAGPGDPGLLTLKAQKRLSEADLVIYDYLANPQHLKHVSNTAKVMGVGKGFRHKKIPQQRINALIVENARMGHNVVRLKGGDPFLFGRGGEEALFLKQHSIPFEVVPGITSAVACAAYAGIPMTHRDHNTAVTFITGHRANDRSLDGIDWSKIVTLDGTIAIYMGLYNLPSIVKRLMGAGMPGRTPVAVIEWGTMPRQRSCTAPLDKIADMVKRKGIQPPAMILVGEVVTLSNKLNWYESLPLFGQKIVVTRMKGGSSELCSRLEALGAEAISFPVIDIRPAADHKPIDRAIRNISAYNWIVFTSAYGVNAFFARISKLGLDARALKGTRVAVVGAETGKALLKMGIRADLTPHDFQVESLGHQLGRQIKKSGRAKVLLARTDIAPPTLERILAGYNAKVTPLTVYRTTRPAISTRLKMDILRSGADWVTFTSSSAANNFVKILGSSAVRAMSKTTRWASIGPVTTRTLRALGLRPTAQATRYDLDGLVSAIVKKGIK